jgi:hypothetical protein
MNKERKKGRQVNLVANDIRCPQGCLLPDGYYLTTLLSTCA